MHASKGWDVKNDDPTPAVTFHLTLQLAASLRGQLMRRRADTVGQRSREVEW
jgi:hypothetical protein